MVLLAGHWEEARGEEEERPGKKEREERGRLVALLGVSRGSFLSPGSRRWKQEVASGYPRSSTQVLLCPNEEDKVSFALSPLALGSFLGKCKTEPLFYDLKIKTCSRD
jgi:hypothetical protein